MVVLAAVVCVIGILGAVPATQAARVTDGLLCNWTFDEGQDNTAADSGPREYDGTLTGSGVSWVDGQVGSAVRFAGGRSYYVDCGVASRNLPAGLSAATLAFWAKTESDQGYLFCTSDDNDSRLGAQFGSGNMTGCVGSKGAGENWTDGAWHHYALTWSENGNGWLRTYVDGQYKSGGNPLTTTLVASSTNLRFGVKSEYPFNNAGFEYQGAVDEVAIWDRGLTANEIAEVYEVGLLGHNIGWVAPEPAGLGLVGLALVALRRKRR